MQHPHSVQSEKQKLFLIMVGLALLTWAVYGPVGKYGFMTLDDGQYPRNKMVQKGLTLESAQWALTYVTPYWHPLTWVSHLLDASLFGPGNAPRFHQVNVVLHLASGLLLFLFLQRATGGLWRSAMVSALFLVHPLQIESVAWISERKNLLSGFLWILAMYLYLDYVNRPTRLRFGMVFAAMAAGLLAKPIAVTLPFVFLLLDAWPLRRLTLEIPWRPRAAEPDQADASVPASDLRQRILEKWPLFALSGASIVASMAVSHYTGELAAGEPRPLALRAANAAVSVWSYVGKLLWPDPLALFYPFPASIPAWKTAATAMLLLVSGGLIFAARRQRGYLFAGWFWFLGSMVPVLGLVQQGTWPQMADRFAYISCIGFFVAVIWTLGELVRNRVAALWAGGVVFTACLIGLVHLSRQQLSLWEKPSRLWEHTISVTESDAYSWSEYFHTLVAEGEMPKALDAARRAVDVDPARGISHIELGKALLSAGRADEARISLKRGAELVPKEVAAPVWITLAQLAKSRGETVEAIRCCTNAIAAVSWDYSVSYVAGVLLLGFNEPTLAMEGFNTTLRFSPDHALSHSMLAECHLRLGDGVAARREAQIALQLTPRSAVAHNTMGFVLASTWDTEGSLRHYSEALRLDPKNLQARENLAKAQAELLERDSAAREAAANRAN